MPGFIMKNSHINLQGFKTFVKNILGKLAACLLCCIACAGNAADPVRLLLTAEQMRQIKNVYGDDASNRIAQWQALLQQLSSDDQLVDTDKMSAANDFFNKVPWLSDMEHWGVEDYWATPVEMLGTNGGDCEDFSVSKYFTLTDVGILRARLRLTYVKAVEYNQAHMVLAYYPTPASEPLILDNINKRIVPASERPDLVPVYSFNAEGLWLAQARGRQLSSDSEGSLPHWRAVNERLRKQSLDLGRSK